MDWKDLPLVDLQVVKFLRKKYPAIEYKKTQTNDEFINESIYRAGQRDVINALENIINLQKKRKN
jgi:hypothetical protein